MKKIRASFFLGLSALLSLTGCGENPKASTSSVSSQSSTSLSTEESRPMPFGNPMINFYGETDIKARSDESLFLPSYDLLDSNYFNLPSSCLKVTHTIDGELSDQPYLPGSNYRGVYASGTHEFKFLLTDPLNNLTDEKTVTLLVYQILFVDNEGDPYLEVSGEETGHAIVTTKNEGISVKTFNQNRSFEYYAEAYYNGFLGGYRGFGLLHATDKNLNDPSCSFVRDIITTDPSTDNQWFHRFGKSWMDDYVRGNCWFDQGTEPLFPQKPTLNDPAVFNKFAVARNHEYFYTFFNDKLIDITTYDEFKFIKTVPGLTLSDYGSKSNIDQGGYVTDISFCTGARALNKIGALTNGTKLFNYLRYDDPSDMTEYATFYQKNETYGDYFEYNDNGLTHDSGGKFYDCTVTPNVRLFGDFKVDFDFEMLKVRNDNIYNHAWIMFNEAKYGDNGYKTERENCYGGMTLYYKNSTSFDTGTGMWEDSRPNTHIKGDKWVATAFDPAEMKTALGLGEGNDRIHFTIEGSFNLTNNKVVLKYSFFNMDDLNKSYSYKATSYRSENIKPLYMYFSCIGLSYRVSNFTFASTGSPDF